MTTEEALDGAPAQIAALFTPIPNGRVLAALCALNGIKAQVLETSAGAIAVLDDATPDSLHGAAHSVSSFTKERPLVAMERRDGQITVWKYSAGQRGETLPPGLALNDAPGVVTTLMTGAQTIADVAVTHADKVFDAHMGKLAAFRQLRKLSAQAKREAKSQRDDR